MQFGDTLKEILTPEEQIYLRAVNLARSYGLNIYAPDYHFLVVTVIVRAGFDLKGTVFESNLSGNAINHKEFVTIVNYEKDGKKIRKAILHLPPATITDVEIEDPIRDRYPFPDVKLSPNGWKDIAGFIKDNMISKSTKEGIKAKALENVQAFLRELLGAAGFEEVEFVDANS